MLFFMLSAAPAPRRLLPLATLRAFPHPVASSTSAASNLNIEVPSERDLKCIERRQLGHQMTNIVGVGCRCKHGFPQAFVTDPLGRAPDPVHGTNRKSKVESGLFRLSCPLLVKAVDEWEKEGAVRAINDEVSGEENLAAMLEEAHAGHAEARREVLGGPEVIEELKQSAAVDGEEQTRIVEMVLDSGVAGQTRSKLDVKCVHAQLADHFCRDESNGIASVLLERLRARGAKLGGDDRCWAQCNPIVPEGEAKEVFWYEPSKNKWKLKKRRQANKREREHHAAVQVSRAMEEREGAGPHAGASDDVYGEDALRELDRASA